MGLQDEIKKAVGDHGKWKKILKDAINTGEIEVQISSIKSDHECSFGKWLYGSTITEQEKSLDHYKKVMELHASFHEIAAQVAQYSVSGHKERAIKMLEMNGDFTTTSAELTTSMIAWLNESIHDQAKKSGARSPTGKDNAA